MSSCRNLSSYLLPPLPHLPAPGNLQIRSRGGHLGPGMNSPHDCLCHRADFSIDTASLLFRVLHISKQILGLILAQRAATAAHRARRVQRHTRARDGEALIGPLLCSARSWSRAARSTQPMFLSECLFFKTWTSTENGRKLPEPYFLNFFYLSEDSVIMETRPKREDKK